MVQIRTDHELFAREHYDKLQKKILAQAEKVCKPVHSFLSKENNKNLRIILSGSLAQLIELDHINKAFFDKHKKKISSIFKYSTFCREKIGYDAYDLAEKLKVNVCPYCNRQFTFTIKSTMRPEFDHYLFKEIYPQFALSFYNLIPSCHSCNHKKHTHDVLIKPLIYPYEESFGNIRFSSSISNVKAIISKKSSDLTISLPILQKNKESRSEVENKAINSIEIFALDKIYRYHKDYVHEIIQKAYVYSDSRVKELYESFPSLFGSEADIQRMAFGNYIQEVDLDKRPLSKLTRDILLELGIITEL